MTIAALPPPCIPASLLLPTLQQQGYAVLNAAAVAEQSGVAPAALHALAPAWDDLPPDQYLKDGGRYRRRRHACFVLQSGAVAQVAHRAHWQPLQYNALHGGMLRWFEPMSPDTVAQPAFTALLQWLGVVASQLKGAQPWYVEAHPFRIDTTDGIGRPTPEGAHRDGVDLRADAFFQIAHREPPGPVDAHQHVEARLRRDLRDAAPHQTAADHAHLRDRQGASAIRPS